MKPKLLDLFCGAGGCSVGYARAGFEVVGVDIEPQPNYPFEFFRADAMDVAFGLQVDCLIGEIGERYQPGDFVAVHASPPCQAYSSVTGKKNRDNHPDLVGPTRKLLTASGIPYVIENVVGAPLRDPIRLCGSSFALRVRRHRLFESSEFLMSMPCAHGWQTPMFDVYEHGKWIKSPVARVYGLGGGKARESWPEAMGIDWMSDPELAQAIPPAYTEFIGKQLLIACDLPRDKTGEPLPW